MEFLEVHNLTKRFGGVAAVQNISFCVKKAEILGLIGPNGAGKTTLINLICGSLKRDAGKIYFKGEAIEGLSPYKIAQRRIGRTFQITKVFRKMTTLENMMVPATWLSGKFQDFVERAFKFLEFFELMDLKDELAGNLSGGQQKLLELARASMMDPELLLLDEPFHGVHPTLKDKIIGYIKSTNKSLGKTFIVSSHDIPSIMGLCERLIVMNAGYVIATGAPKDIRRDEKVHEVYLGERLEAGV